MSSAHFGTRLTEWLWYEDNALSAALLPAAWLFVGVTALRRSGYRRGWLRSYPVGVPVIVVGNITVGGAGKTPLVIRVVEKLRELGFRPGIISRGYGGTERGPRHVTAESDPARVGDEPVLLAQRLDCPVAVASKRIHAARLLQSEDADVLVSDDGLQHYALARDVEIAVLDGARRLGNGRPLPAGPLREPRRRLETVDAMVENGGPQAEMRMIFGHAVSLADGAEQPLASFCARRVHALAGTGNPEKFFSALRAQGLDIEPHPFPDHHRFSSGDLAFGDGAAVLMTEKDAVKCRGFTQPGLWAVPARAQLSRSAEARLDSLFRGLR
jgi:tetraacyldisaccharide 4'-kinase